MDEELIIPVGYKGEELEFKARLLNFGYSYKIQLEVNGVEILLEPDEERNFRVVIDPESLSEKDKIDTELLKAIVSALESAVK